MMNKTEIFNKIGAIVTEIHEQYSYLSEHPDNMNDLELELFLANSKFLTGHIEVFQKLNRAPATEKAVAEKTESSTPPVDPKTPEAITDVESAQPEQEAMVEANEPKQVEKPEQENITRHMLDAEAVEDEPSQDEPEATAPAEPQQIKEEPTKQEPAVIEPSASEQPALEEPVVKEKPVVHEVVIEEKTIEIPKKEAEPEHVPTLNDVISAQLNPQGTLGSQFNAQPVKDLKSIISLNDKLLFVKDLFNGYSLAYSEAIELLNRFDKFEAADTFLKTNYATKNNWATKQSTVEHFYEILSRRFGK